MNKEINVNLIVGDKVLLDMLTTCYEGGSAYWLACHSVHRDKDLNVTLIEGCYDAEDEETKFPDARPETMLLGMKRILDGSVAVRQDIRGSVLAAVLDDDNADWDAEVADCVLQAGLLNETVYD